MYLPWSNTGKVAQQGCGLSILGGVQDSRGLPEQADLRKLALCGDWPSWPLQQPFQPKLFCDSTKGLLFHILKIYLLCFYRQNLASKQRKEGHYH